jgi:hypothetical protein
MLRCDWQHQTQHALAFRLQLTVLSGSECSPMPESPDSDSRISDAAAVFAARAKQQFSSPDAAGPWALAAGASAGYRYFDTQHWLALQPAWLCQSHLL